MSRLLRLALVPVLLGVAFTSAGEDGWEKTDRPAVKFSIEDVSGGRHTEKAFEGKVVVVDFWDTWCGPCLRALPHLKELSRSHPGEVVVIAVALGQEGEGKVREVVARQELPFAVALLGAQGDLAPAFGNIDQLPTTFLVGPDGVIRQRWIGAQSLPTYEKAVRALLPAQGG